MSPESALKLPAESYIDAVVNPMIDHWSHLRCGSYTSEWVARAVGIKPISSNRLLPGPVWFDLFRPVTPYDMRQLFKAKGMNTEEISVANFSDEEKLAWIKREIATHKRPPVLLIRTKLLHWIAIGGYSDLERIFYTYDPNIGSSSLNTGQPIGNSHIGYDELISVWRGRFMFRYIALVVTHVGVRDLKKEKIEAILEAYARGELVHRDVSVNSAREQLSPGSVNKIGGQA